MIPTDSDAALRRLLEDGRARATLVDPHHALLWGALEDATKGGKRFRPRLVAAIHDALGGERAEAVAQVGAALELLHTALVVHDDVIDDDHLRRGRPNVSGTFRTYATTYGAATVGSSAYGMTAAVLAGDLALAAAIRAAATCGAPIEVVEQLLDLFDAALHTTAAGELADVRLALGVTEATLAETLAMEEQKTGAYSFALPLQAGAVLADADTTLTARLGDVGRMTGVAFQLIDDLIGVFGDPEQSGKSTTSDLRTGKQTPLLVHARTTAQWDQISTFVGRDLDAQDLDAVRTLLTASGSRQFVEELAEQHLARARAVIDELGLALPFVDTLTTRSTILTTGPEAAA